MACDLPVMKQRLCEAEDSLHAIAIGRSARVVVDHNGERIEYNSQNLTGLRGYIEILKSDISVCEGNGPLGNKAMRPWGLV